MASNKRLRSPGLFSFTPAYELISLIVGCEIFFAVILLWNWKKMDANFFRVTTKTSKGRRIRQKRDENSLENYHFRTEEVVVGG